MKVQAMQMVLSAKATSMKINITAMTHINIKVSKVEFLETPKSKSTFYARS